MAADGNRKKQSLVVRSSRRQCKGYETRETVIDAVMQRLRSFHTAGMKHANTLATLFAAASLLTLGVCIKTTPAQPPVKDTSPAVLGKAEPKITEPKPPLPPPIPPEPVTIVRSAKTIYVKSSSVLVGQAVIETKLRNRSEFQQLGLIITRDPLTADLILELEHDVFTKYVYTAIDPHTSAVVASGKLSSLGGTVAGKVAERFLKQMLKARSQPEIRR